MKLSTLALAALGPIALVQPAFADSCDNVDPGAIEGSLAEAQHNLGRTAGGWHTPVGRQLEEQSRNTEAYNECMGADAHPAFEALENSLGINNDDDN
jgi:hypothetical protein